MNMHKVYRHTCRTLAAASAIAWLATAAVAADARKPTDCLQIVQIKNTRIVDDQNIVFETRGREFYNNHLPRKCPGLKSADKFRYKTSQSVLCNVDIITVLLDAGSSLMDGASCGLGIFTPIPDPNKKDPEKEQEKAS